MQNSNYYTFNDMDDNSIRTEVDGIIFLSTGKYYDGINDMISHDLKKADNDAIRYAARKMATLVPENAVLVPIPNHNGKARETLSLAIAVAQESHSPIANVLNGRERESNYLMKKLGKPLTEEQMGFRQFAPLPKGHIPVLIDGVVDTGTTAKAAVKALGGGIVLSFAMSDTLLKMNMEQSNGFHR